MNRPKGEVMRKWKWWWWLCFPLVVACSGSTPYQEAPGPTAAAETGHWSKPLDLPRAFELSVQVSESISAPGLSAYTGRAAGELCAEKGFTYFDLAPIAGSRPAAGILNMRNVVICHKEGKKRGLDVEFRATPKGLLVADRTPSGSMLRQGDVVLAAGGRKLEDVATLKLQILRLTQKNSQAKTIALRVQRQGKKQLLQEPLRWSAAVFGAEDLQRFRKAEPYN